MRLPFGAGAFHYRNDTEESVSVEERVFPNPVFSAARKASFRKMEGRIRMSQSENGCTDISGNTAKYQ